MEIGSFKRFYPEFSDIFGAKSDLKKQRMRLNLLRALVRFKTTDKAQFFLQCNSHLVKKHKTEKKGITCKGLLLVQLLSSIHLQWIHLPRLIMLDAERSSETSLGEKMARVFIRFKRKIDLARIFYAKVDLA